MNSHHNMQFYIKQWKLTYWSNVSRTPDVFTLSHIPVPARGKIKNENPHVGRMLATFQAVTSLIHTAKRKGGYTNALHLSILQSFCLWHFHVHSISHEPCRRFSLKITQMFLSVRGCEEHMTQQSRLKIKVTGQGQRIYHWIFCSLHISWTLKAIFIKLLPSISLSEMMCRIHDSPTQSQGQGHTSRSCDLLFKFCFVLSISPTLVRIVFIVVALGPVTC